MERKLIDNFIKEFKESKQVRRTTVGELKRSFIDPGHKARPRLVVSKETLKNSGILKNRKNIK
jgi:hypothetical protein|tara:strand:- start:1589 stop:1777 length:189 start_codon:yes stop_codon:yes gene_type:complete